MAQQDQDEASPVTWHGMSWGIPTSSLDVDARYEYSHDLEEIIADLVISLDYASDDPINITTP